MGGNDLPTPRDGFKTFPPPSCTKGVNSPSGRFSRDLPATLPHGTRLELALALAGLLMVAATFAGHHLALAGLAGLLIAGNARRRPSSPRTRVGQLTEGPERSNAC